MNLGDQAETIKKYFDENKFAFVPIRQKEDEISRAYGVHGYPTNYVLDREGKVADRMVGFDPERLKAALDKLVDRR